MRISHLFRNPTLRAAFARIERDAGDALVLPKRPEPVLSGGAAERILESA